MDIKAKVIALSGLYYGMCCTAAVLNTTAIQGLRQNDMESVTNFTKVHGNQSVLSTEMKDTPTTNVAFMARLSNNIENPSTGHIVIFDQEILDTSNSYNPHIGVFRVPVSGVYCISLTAASQGEPGNGRVLHLHLKGDGTSVGYVFLDSDDLHWLRRNEIVILHLNVGDNVYVQVDIVHNHCTLNGDGLNTHLQGFLIFPY